MAWTLKDIPTFYIDDGKKLTIQRMKKKTLLTEWKAYEKKIENEN